MSMEIKARAARPTARVLEQLGQAVGSAAGGAALVLLWGYSLATNARETLRAARARKPRRPGSGSA